MHTAVLDSGALLRRMPLTPFAETYVTVPEVLAELQDSASKQFLASLPFPVHTRQPSPDAMIKAMACAKDTGDYGVLSLADIKVIALALTVLDELKREQKPDEPDAAATTTTLTDQLSQLQVKDETTDGWITEDNLSKHLLRDSGISHDTDAPTASKVKVACVTGDFAVQNVLMRLGLSVVSPTGALIKRVKSFVLRCHACSHVTTDMSKRFCPNCGGPTLTRVSSAMSSGKEERHLYFKRNYQYKLRGTKYSIPKMQGGKKSSQDMILREDQKEFVQAEQVRQRLEKKIADPDRWGVTYGFGARTNGTPNQFNTLGAIGYGRRNPNESRGKLGRKR